VRSLPRLQKCVSGNVRVKKKIVRMMNEAKYPLDKVS